MKVIALCLCVLGVLAPRLVLADATHIDKFVQTIHPAASYGGCYWFRLVGVAEADPSAAGNVWFAVSMTHPAAKDIFATLMAAKLADRPVTVVTAGPLICGAYASVHYLFMN